MILLLGMQSLVCPFLLETGSSLGNSEILSSHFMNHCRHGRGSLSPEVGPPAQSALLHLADHFISTKLETNHFPFMPSLCSSTPSKLCKCPLSLPTDPQNPAPHSASPLYPYMDEPLSFQLLPKASRHLSNIPCMNLSHYSLYLLLYFLNIYFRERERMNVHMHEYK